jgi:hypothetical protein
MVLRGGQEESSASGALMSGDGVLLAAGAAIPVDCRLLTERALFLAEVALSGASFPDAKRSGMVPAQASLAAGAIGPYLATHVVSGSRRCSPAAGGAAAGGEPNHGRSGQDRPWLRSGDDLARGLSRIAPPRLSP